MSSAPIRTLTALPAEMESTPVHAEELSTRLLDKTGLECLPEDFVIEARKLVGNLTVQSSMTGKAFGFCGSRMGEGVSTVCTSTVLALATATVGNVLYIDANFADPLRFSRDSGPGFSDVLLGRCELADALQQVDSSSVFLLGVGTVVDGVSAQFGDERLLRLLQEIRTMFAVTIVDLAPPAASPFGVRLARVLDGVIVVVEAHSTERAEVESTVGALRRAQAPVTGLVYNRRRFRA